MDELKPCPFCGGQAFVHKFTIDGACGLFISVMCRVCYAQTGNKTKESYAIEAWNKRADDGE